MTPMASRRGARMAETDVFLADCPARTTLDLVAKW